VLYLLVTGSESFYPPVFGKIQKEIEKVVMI